MTDTGWGDSGMAVEVEGEETVARIKMFTHHFGDHEHMTHQIM